MNNDGTERIWKINKLLWYLFIYFGKFKKPIYFIQSLISFKWSEKIFFVISTILPRLQNIEVVIESIFCNYISIKLYCRKCNFPEFEFLIISIFSSKRFYRLPTSFYANPKSHNNQNIIGNGIYPNFVCAINRLKL